MKVTLTQLHRDTGSIVRQADAGEEVILTEHGKDRYKLTAIRPVDRKQALKDLQAIGPVDFLPRQ